MNRTSIAICFGISVGAMTGLLVGDVWSAVWLGAFCAALAGWLAVLDWEKIRDKANQHKFTDCTEKLATKFGVAGAGKAILSGCVSSVIVAGLGIAGAVKSAYRAAGKMKRIVKYIANDGYGQRMVIGQIFLLFFSSFIIWYQTTLIFGIDTFFPFGWAVIITIILSWVVPVFISVTAVCWVIFLAVRTVSWARNEIAGKHIVTGRKLDVFSTDKFGLDWLNEFCNSDRSTIEALFEMMVVRFWNALKILLYCLAVWPLAIGFAVLEVVAALIIFAVLLTTESRVRSASLLAGVLSLIQLGGSYLWWGGIALGNLNFWISLAAALAVGAGAGSLIEGKGRILLKKASGKLESIVFSWWPTPSFAHQSPVLRSF